MKQKRYKQFTKETDFDTYLKEQLKNPKFKRAYEEEGLKLEIAYAINRLRRKSKVTQKTLAKKLGTTQSVIARMEQGNQNFTLATLQKIAEAFGKKVEVSFA